MAKWEDSYHNGVVDAAHAITSLIDGRVLNSMSARDGGGDDWKYKLLRTMEIHVLLELKEKITPVKVGDKIKSVREELGYGEKKEG